MGVVLFLLEELLPRIRRVTMNNKTAKVLESHCDENGIIVNRRGEEIPTFQKGKP